MAKKVGILLTNIGTPHAPTTLAVKKYLNEFLSDRRVVDIHPLIWQPILKGVILPTRAKQSAKLYQKIWMDQGSPLLIYSKSIAQKLQEKLGQTVTVALGMHYSEPTIETALNELRDQGCEKIIVLPLYPQYSTASTASTFDQVIKKLNAWRHLPEMHFMNDYADHPVYIDAIASAILKEHLTNHLLFSFHGMPMRAIQKGDPYYQRCSLTANLISEKLQLAKGQWSFTFQSRLGRAQWLTPYTDLELQTMPSRGIKDLAVICPGFAVDCLETLEEIAIRGREQFLQAGGHSFQYIPALNDTPPQIELLVKIIHSMI